uniref:Protein kinase domain-containing protein n=1 Tax=Aegilops tauschii subsp. strangulata TaxID=200361 RepID=A0A453ADS3_AEGTS
IAHAIFSVAVFDDIMRGECPTYLLETIRASTDGFRPENEIGRGGFGIVYKGQMPDGQEVAVKRLSAENRVQGLKEFKNEVDLIAKLQHRNLVRLLGCCIHCLDRILVYEYMSNKSLDTFIFDPRRRATLSWKARMDIILGVARGLVYLHQDSRHTMIHRDLKAANVLLNEEMVAKISDFGIAKLFSSSGDNSQDSTITERIVGTYGYMSPEYAMDGMVSFMQDVYSFGVLLLEIVSGRRNQRSFNLIAHAWNLYEENRSLELLDPAVRGGCSPAELEHVKTWIQVGLLCVQESPSQRPQMAAVIPMLSHQQAPGRPLRPVVCMPARTPVDLLNMEENTSSNELTITNLEGR